MSFKKNIIPIVLLVLASVYPSFGQVHNPDDPKVGLVLSGGGAKGLAHIGALKVIEEAGVRIDYIGGTSMGAIVGSLYAAGYSAAQLDSIFRVTNFDVLLQDQIPRSSMSFYEKRNYETYIGALPFDNFKVSLPTSLSKGQNLYNLLTKLFFNVEGIYDFNELPIPFFCMATDVETGDPIKIDKGYLPKAVAASAAIPSFFEPVLYQDKLLVDGGVVNNYPIDEVIEMGADIIIGVDVQDSLLKRDKLKSATDVLVQINYYNTINAMKEKLPKTDLYIKPNITGFDVLSFGKGKEIIQSGYQAAVNKLSGLDSIAALQILKPKPRTPERVKDSFLINKLVFEGNEKYTRAYLKGKLRYTTEEYTTFEEIGTGMSNLAATDNFRSVRYEFHPMDQGYKLVVPVKEKKNDMYLKFGIHYDGLYKTAGLINLTRKHLLFDDDVGYFDFILGDNIRYNFHYYLDKGFYWSYGIKSRLNTFDRDVDYSLIGEDLELAFPDVNRLDIEMLDLTNQIYMQTVWREEFTLGVGLEHKLIEIDSKTFADEGGDELELEKGNFFSSYGYVRFDSLDDKYYPTKGLFFEGDFHWIIMESGYMGDFSPYSIAKANMGFAVPITKDISFNMFTEGGFHLGNAEVESLKFILGGWGNDFINNITPFLGYDYLSFGGNGYVKATFNADWEFFKNNHLNVTANFANAGDGIFESGEWFTLPDYTGYAVGYGYESIIGPIQAKFNWSPEVNEKFLTFSVGYWF